MINNHSHSGLGGDGEKINYNNLANRPVVINGDTLDIRITNPSAGQVLTYNVGGYWENV